MANKRKTLTTPEGPGGPGGQELPGNNFMDAICGALGALAYGDSKIKNQSDLMSAVGQQSKLYSILESLNKNNKGEDKNKLVSVETSTFMKDMGQVMKNNITDPLNEQFLIMNENLLNTGNQIRDFIENYDYVTNTFDNINNTLSCIEEGLINRENLPEVKIANEITGSNNLPELIKSLENINSEELKDIYEKLNTALSVLNNIDVVKAEKSIKSINEILKSTLNIGAFLDKNDNNKKLKENIENVVGIFKNNNGSLKELFNSLRTIVGKNKTEVGNDVIVLAELLGNLITVISMDQSKVSVTGIRLLRNILRPSGPIDSILKDLNRISKKEIPTSTKSIKDIFSIVSSFKELGKIGFFAAINARRGLRILSDFIRNDFKDIFTVISSTKETGEKEAKTDIQSIIDTIDLITKIGELNVDLREVKRRIKRISNTIITSMGDLFSELAYLRGISGDAIKNTESMIKSLQSILNVITSINNIKYSVIDDSADKIDIISKMFGNDPEDQDYDGQINKLLINLSDKSLEEICENANNTTNEIENTISSIVDLFGIVPGFGELFKTSFKLELLSENIESINNVITGNEEDKIIGISNIKVNNQEIHRVITAVNNIINFINSTNENLSEDGLNELIKKNVQIITLLNTINREFILTNSIEQLDENKLKTIEEFILNFSEFGSIGVSLSTINNESLDKINVLLEIIKSLSSSLLYVNNLKKLEIKEGDLDGALEVINQINIITNLITDSVSKDKVDKIKNKSAEICALCDIFKSIAIINKVGPAAKLGLKSLESSVDKINEIIGKFNEIDVEKVNAATQMMNAFAKLMIISAAVLIVGALAMTFIDVKNLISFGITLGAFMFLLTSAISDLGKEITNSFNIIEDFTLLMVASAAVLILGGLAMNIIDTGNLILFGVTLLSFVWALTIPFKSFAKNGKEAMDGMNDFTIFVVASAAVLILGGLVMGAIKVGDLFIFTGTLLSFITAMVLPFWLFNKFAKEVMDSMHDFTIFVVASAAVLILGGLVMGAIKVGDLFIFTGTLLSFITAMVLPFWLFNKFAKGAMRGMKNFSIFVVSSAAVLILGSLVMGAVDKGNLLVFTGTLLSFITAMTLPFILFNKFGKGAMKGMREFTILVVASATVLLLGSMLMDHINTSNLVAFAIILAGFIWGITKAASSNSKGIRKAAKPLLMMVGVVAMAAGILILGSWAMSKIDPIGIVLFTVILAGFMLGMVDMLKMVNKFKKDIFIGIGALGAMTLIVGLSAGALILVGKVMRENDLSSLLIGVGVIALVIVGIAGIAMGLGAIVTSGIGGAILLAGIGAMGAVVSIAIMAGVALSAIGHAMKIMAEIGPFDASAMTQNITALLSLATALAPIGALSVLIIPASISLMMMSTMMSEIAQAVKDYAELKIPLYKGTKIVGYRHLNKKDFQSAGENIKKVIVTMAEAIVETYNMKPELFEQPTGLNMIFGDGKSKFDRIVKSVRALGKLMTDICSGVQSYANLVYPIEWNKEGKAIKFRQMKENEIIKAGENIKKVIITMASAIVETYDMKPELFEQPTGLNMIFGDGKSKFDRIVKSVTALGKLMNNICSGVQSYANLVYPIEWNKEGKAIKFRQMKENEIIKAGENIKKVIITMASAIVETYDMKPELFEQPTGLNMIFGDGKSKFDRIVKSVRALGKLMTSICSGIQSYANLVYPIEWNKEGKAIKYKLMKSSDIIKAGENIKKVIITMAEAIVETYDMKPELFAQPTGLNMIFGDGKSKFDKIVKSVTGLGKLMSNICSGIQSYANLAYPIEWNKEGKAIKYKLMKPSDIIKAGENIKEVIITMSRAIFEVYDEKPEMFKEPEASGLAGLFGKKDKSKFSKVMGTIGGLGILMKDICTSLQAYASLQYPIEWNSNGQAIKFNNVDIVNAGKNIKEVIITMSRAIFEAYDEKPEMFEEPEASGLAGFFGKKDKSKFSKVMGTIGGLGILMKDICTSLQAYANLQYPVEWNSEGQAIKFNNIDVVKAGENIKLVVKTLSKAIFEVYNKNPEMFEEPSAKGLGGFIGKKEKSKMNKIMSSIAGLGNLVAGISQSIKDFATMQYACEWNADGNPIKYIKVGEAEFKAAGENIGTVITTISNALVGVYKNNPGGMFDDELVETGFIIKSAKKLEGTSPVAKTIKALSGMGELVASLAGSVKDFATMQYPDQWNDQGTPIHYVKISSSDRKLAIDNIGSTITTVGNALISVYQGKSWKDMIMAKEYVVPMINNISGSIGKIAIGVRQFAINKIPTWYNKDGKPMDPVIIDYKAASTTVGTAVSTIGKELIKVANGEYDWDIKKAIDVSKSILNISKSIIPIALGLKMFAIEEIPIAYDKNGKPTKTQKIDFNKAAKTAGNLMGVLAKTIIDIYNGKSDINNGQYGFSLPDFENANKKVIPLINSIIEMLSPLAQSLYFYGISEIPVKLDKDGNPIEFKKVDFVQAANTVSKVLDVLPSSIIKIANGTYTQNLNEVMTIVPSTLEKIRNILSPLGESLYLYGTQQVPVKYDNMGNPIEFKKVDFEQAANTAGSVMKSILEPIGTVINQYDWHLYKEKSEIMFNVLTKIIGNAGKLANSIYIYGTEEVPTKFDKDGNVIESKKVDFKNASIVLSSVFQTLADSMKTSIKLMNWDFYEEESEAMFNGLNKYISNIGKLGNVLKWYSLKQIPLSVDKDGNPTRLIKFNPENAIQNATKIVITLAESFDTIIDKHSETFEKINEQKLFDTLVDLVSKLHKTSITLSKILPINENTNNLLQALDGHTTKLNNIFRKNTVNDYTEWSVKSSTFTDIIKLLSRSYSYISEINEEPFNILAEGIDKVNEKISEMPSQDIFSQHEQILSRYVRSIDKIDIKKVNSLTNLINSMNILGYKMGNLDNLTKVLADQISTVLKKLTEQLAKAAQTIKDAEKLQKFRENSIRKSINEIHHLLGQTMKVEISQSSGDTLSTPDGKGSVSNKTNETRESGGNSSGLSISEENNYKPNKESNIGTISGGNESQFKYDQRRMKNERITLSGYVIRDNKGKPIGKITKN